MKLLTPRYYLPPSHLCSCQSRKHLPNISFKGKPGTLPILSIASYQLCSIIRTMPRIARIIAAGAIRIHITQRGNNRVTVFFDDEDRQTYLKILAVARYIKRNPLKAGLALSAETYRGWKNSLSALNRTVSRPIFYKLTTAYGQPKRCQGALM